MSKIINISNDDFQKEVIDCDIPVLVDFWTDNCGPCESMAPLLEEFADRLDGKLKIVKFYVSIEEVLEQTNEIAQRYDVMGFPTLFVFKSGEVAATSLGGLFVEGLQELIDSVF